ncbi:MAG: dual OB domain-containing protein [Pseudanabaena sp.]
MTEIVCLANSRKHNNKCVAGLNLKTGQWIRPVTNTEDGAIPNYSTLINGKSLQILDLVDIPLNEQERGKGYESENRLIQSGEWKISGQIQPSDLLKFRESELLHFEEDAWLQAIPYKYLRSLPRNKCRTLQLVQTDNFRVRQKESDKWRGIMPIGNSDEVLNASITDPKLCRLLDSGHQVSSNCLLVISLSQPFQKSEESELMCHRLIAGVVELTGDEFCPIAELIIEIDREIERVGWSKEHCVEYLVHNFQKRSRTLMNLEELHQFLNYLRKLSDCDV